MKKDLREQFGTLFDDGMMMMARQFSEGSEEFSSENIDNIFNMVYGFEMTSSPLL